MEASENDAERIAALLTASALSVDADTIRARVADENGGVLVAASACVSWALDGGVLHLYDFAIAAPAFGEDDDLAALVSAANTLANGRFAAVIATTLWVDNPLSPLLQACGFALDWEETDVRNGKPAQLAGLVREVT